MNRLSIILLIFFTLVGCNNRNVINGYPSNPSHTPYFAPPQVPVNTPSAQKIISNTASRILQVSANKVLSCFHPSQEYISISINGTNVDGNLEIAEGDIYMRGILNKYWMHVTLAYDPSDDTVRLLPGKSNTLFPAKTDCGLRRWVKIDQIGQAARSAVNDFHNQVLGTIAIGSAAVYIMSQEKASNRVSSCTQDALVHYAANSATKAVLSNPVAQSAAASALAQAYNGSVSGGRVVKDVAVSLFKQELAKKDPAYAYAFSSASFLVCAFNQ